MGLERIRKTHIRCPREQKPSGGLALLTCSPAHRRRCLPGPGFHRCYARTKPPSCAPPSSLLPPGQTMNQPGLKPAWKRGGWFRSGTCPGAQHPAGMLMLAVKRSRAAARERGYAAKASAACLETISEAQRGRSCLRKQTNALLNFPSVYRNCSSTARHRRDRWTDNRGGTLCGLQQGEPLPAPAVAAWGLKGSTAEVNGANPSLS